MFSPDYGYVLLAVYPDGSQSIEGWTPTDEMLDHLVGPVQDRLEQDWDTDTELPILRAVLFSDLAPGFHELTAAGLRLLSAPARGSRAFVDPSAPAR